MKSATYPSHVSVVLLLALLYGCATNPATGERQLSLISEEQEIQMGKQAAAQVQQTLGFVDDADLQRYVAGIGQRLAASSERPNLPWEFHVVDDPTPNAFALPGGFIYVTRGMMNLMTSEAELAAVLGHEIGHVTARHSVNQISKQQLAQLGVGLGGIFFPETQGLSPLVGAGLELLFLKYSRDDERESDALGFKYTQQTGYATGEAADVFAALERASAAQEGGGIPDWLSTHPSPAERVETARARAAESPQANARVGVDEYLTQIDGLVYGSDPRQGFFRESTFYHPQLRFQLQFPAGWRTQNLAQAVVAVAPNGAAALELTLTPDEDPVTAARRFASQQGLQVGQAEERSLRGGRAVVAEFLAQTQQGAVRGIAAFAPLGGRVYQLVGYSGAASFGSAAPVLQQSIESFGPLTDRKALEVQPRRIEIVRAERDTTLAELAKRTGSDVPVEQLALINHLPGGSARIEAGTLIKTVVS